MKKPSFKEIAQSSYNSGFEKSSEYTVYINIIVFTCMFAAGAYGAFYVFFNGPSMILSRIFLIMVCTLFSLGGLVNAVRQIKLALNK